MATPVDNTLFFEALSPKNIVATTQSTLPLPSGRLLSVTYNYNTTNNIKEAQKHPVADILHACGRLALSIATVACAIISANASGARQNIQEVFHTLSGLLRSPS